MPWRESASCRAQDSLSQSCLSAHKNPSAVQFLSRSLINTLLNLSQETPLDILVVLKELWEEQAARLCLGAVGCGDGVTGAMDQPLPRACMAGMSQAVEESPAYPLQWRNMLWVALFRHKGGSAAQHYHSALWPKAHLYPALLFQVYTEFLKYNPINVLCKVYAFVCFCACSIGCLACKHAERWMNKYDSLHR